MIGTAVGNYVIRQKIGEGGMGAVYMAEHARLSKRVAVKVLLPHLSGNAQLVSRFFNEAKAATEIKNEHIVDVLDFGELPDGASYIVMEWLEGQSLSDLLRREGRLPLARTAHIARGLADALSAAHAHGIVHRDLKPDNVFLVTRSGDPDFVKVLDFGIAKLTLSDASDVRTQTGAIMGTPYYMSPEQCNGASVDQRTDVYSMGIMLYQMLTGTLPFNTAKLTELLVAHATVKPPPLRSHDPSIAPNVESAVLQALEKDPAHRFSSVDALARAFGDEARTLPSATPAAVMGAQITAAPHAKTDAELSVRVRGKGPIYAVVALLAIAVVATVLSTAKKSSVVVPVAEVTPAPVAPAGTPAATTPEAAKPAVASVTRWKLVSTDCGPSVPNAVTTTKKGSSLHTRAPGYPDTNGTAEPDGRFRVHNVNGTCSGKMADGVVSETCTNRFGMSCHARYEQVK